jgi:hypothetical protein
MSRGILSSTAASDSESVYIHQCSCILYAMHIISVCQCTQPTSGTGSLLVSARHHDATGSVPPVVLGTMIIAKSARDTPAAARAVWQSQCSRRVIIVQVPGVTRDGYAMVPGRASGPGHFRRPTRRVESESSPGSGLRAGSRACQALSLSGSANPMIMNT